MFSRIIRRLHRLYGSTPSVTLRVHCKLVCLVTASRGLRICAPFESVVRDFRFGRIRWHALSVRLGITRDTSASAPSTDGLSWSPADRERLFHSVNWTRFFVFTNKAISVTAQAHGHVRHICVCSKHVWPNKSPDVLGNPLPHSVDVTDYLFFLRNGPCVAAVTRSNVKHIFIY